MVKVDLSPYHLIVKGSSPGAPTGSSRWKMTTHHTHLINLWMRKWQKEPWSYYPIVKGSITAAAAISRRDKLAKKEYSPLLPTVKGSS
jgi:hypothetical protein